MSGPRETAKDAAAGAPEVIDMSLDDRPCGSRSARRAAAGSTRLPSTRFQDMTALYPGTADAKGAMLLRAADLNCLEPGQYLNDSIMDFYVRWITEEGYAPQCRDIHVFYSFFFTKLTERPPGDQGRPPPNAEEWARRDHDRVKNWTKGVDIFSKRYLLMLVHSHSHWSLLVICHPAAFAEEGGVAGGDPDVQILEPVTAPAVRRPGQPCILHLDPAGQYHMLEPIVEAVRVYLKKEWAAKRMEEGPNSVKRWHRDHPLTLPPSFDEASMPAKRVHQIPRQDNCFDCGPFVLSYTEFFVAGAPDAIDFEDVTEPSAPDLSWNRATPTFLKEKWFDPINAGLLRGHLASLIHRLMLQQSKLPADKPVMQALLQELQKETSKPVSHGKRYLEPSAYLAYQLFEQEQRWAQEAAARGSPPRYEDTEPHLQLTIAQDALAHRASQQAWAVLLPSLRPRCDAATGDAPPSKAARRTPVRQQSGGRASGAPLRMQGRTFVAPQREDPRDVDMGGTPPPRTAPRVSVALQGEEGLRERAMDDASPAGGRAGGSPHLRAGEVEPLPLDARMDSLVQFIRNSPRQEPRQRDEKRWEQGQARPDGVVGLWRRGLSYARERSTDIMSHMLGPLFAAPWQGEAGREPLQVQQQQQQEQPRISAPSLLHLPNHADAALHHASALPLLPRPSFASTPQHAAAAPPHQPPFASFAFSLARPSAAASSCSTANGASTAAASSMPLSSRLAGAQSQSRHQSSGGTFQTHAPS